MRRTLAAALIAVVCSITTLVAQNAPAAQTDEPKPTHGIIRKARPKTAEPVKQPPVATTDAAAAAIAAEPVGAVEEGGDAALLAALQAHDRMRLAAVAAGDAVRADALRTRGRTNHPPAGAEIDHRTHRRMSQGTTESRDESHAPAKKNPPQRHDDTKNFDPADGLGLLCVFVSLRLETASNSFPNSRDTTIAGIPSG